MYVHVDHYTYDVITDNAEEPVYSTCKSGARTYGKVNNKLLQVLIARNIFNSFNWIIIVRVCILLQ